MVPILKSRLFVLRPFRKGDEESLHRNINDRAIYRFTLRIPYPYTARHAKQWVSLNVKRSQRRLSTLTDIHFAIDIGGEVVGGVGLSGIAGHKAEIGYWLAKHQRGRGIVTEAVKLASRFGFKRLKLRRIYAGVFPHNMASIRVLEKAGFEREGLLRKSRLKNGKLLDELLYAKVR